MALRTLQPRIRTLDVRTAKVPEKRRDPIYGTTEHKLWRHAVMKRAGWRCEHTGCEDRAIYADHVRELKDGGDPLDLSNGQALCASHHVLKTNTERAKRTAQRFSLRT